MHGVCHLLQWLKLDKTVVLPVRVIVHLLVSRTHKWTLVVRAGVEKRRSTRHASTTILCCVQQSERPRTYADLTIENDVRAIVQSANVRGRMLC